MDYEALLLIIGGGAVFVGLLLYLPFFRWFRWPSKLRAAKAKDVPRTPPDWVVSDSPELAEAARVRVFSDQDPDNVRSVFSRFRFRFSKSGGFVIRPDKKAVRWLVKRTFTADNIGIVTAELERYEVEKCAVSTEAIRVHIVHLSGGDVSKIAGLVDAAMDDYRDVVMASESPNIAGRWKSLMQASAKLKPSALEIVTDSSNPETRDAMDADLRQFGMWLLQVTQQQ